MRQSIISPDERWHFPLKLHRIDKKSTAREREFISRDDLGDDSSKKPRIDVRKPGVIWNFVLLKYLPRFCSCQDCHRQSEQAELAFFEIDSVSFSIYLMINVGVNGR
jgi:hypothetical protein